MNKITDLKKYKDFLMIENEKSTIVFSTAKEGRSFNRHTEEGRDHLESLIGEFNVNSIAYLNQIHSDNVFLYSVDNNTFNENQGDSIITNEKNSIIGVFTADCVPVILVDEKKGVVAAIHSGWKGTYNSITKKTVEKMQSNFDSDINDIKVYIGPHIRKCCYEVSEELKDKFINKLEVSEEKFFNGRNLSMEFCIEKDLISSGINEDNINSLNLCTYCEEKIDLFSYRKSHGTYGRLFSFVILK